MCEWDNLVDCFVRQSSHDPLIWKVNSAAMVPLWGLLATWMGRLWGNCGVIERHQMPRALNKSHDFPIRISQTGKSNDLPFIMDKIVFLVFYVSTALWYSCSVTSVWIKVLSDNSFFCFQNRKRKNRILSKNPFLFLFKKQKNSNYLIFSVRNKLLKNKKTKEIYCFFVLLFSWFWFLIFFSFSFLFLYFWCKSKKLSTFSDFVFFLFCFYNWKLKPLLISFFCFSVFAFWKQIMQIEEIKHFFCFHFFVFAFTIEN